MYPCSLLLLLTFSSSSTAKNIFEDPVGLHLLQTNAQKQDRTSFVANFTGKAECKAAKEKRRALSKQKRELRAQLRNVSLQLTEARGEVKAECKKKGPEETLEGDYCSWRLTNQKDLEASTVHQPAGAEWFEDKYQLIPGTTVYRIDGKVSADGEKFEDRGPDGTQNLHCCSWDSPPNMCSFEEEYAQFKCSEKKFFMGRLRCNCPGPNCAYYDPVAQNDANVIPTATLWGKNEILGIKDPVQACADAIAKSPECQKFQQPMVMVLGLGNPHVCKCLPRDVCSAENWEKAKTHGAPFTNQAWYPDYMQCLL